MSAARLAGFLLCAALAACDCAQLPKDALFACDRDGRCAQTGYVCVEGLCRPGLLTPPFCDAERACAAKGAECGTLLACGALVDCGSCPQGTCGAQRAPGPDGGTSPLAHRCAPCVAAGPDEPDDAFADRDCDGIDGAASSSVFVDAEAGDDARAGLLPLEPVRTLERARAVAEASGRSHLLLSRGTYPVAGLKLAAPVSLHGGYDSARGWVRDPPSAPVVLAAGPDGLLLEGGAGALSLDHLSVVAPGGASPGEPSVAVRAVGLGGLSLRHVELVAGDGANGAPGANGDAGAPGADGGSGEAGAQAKAGGGGAPGLNAACAQANGGAGGTGGQYSNLSGASGAGGRGGTSAGGLGGGSGGQEVACTKCSNGGTQCDEVGASSSSGLVGGSEASAAADGEDGQVQSGPGVVQGGRLASVGGGDGKPGKVGVGAGGGGGGGAYVGGPDNNNCQADRVHGGGGGGGAAGGCGGAAGRGGGGGGSSVGLLLVDSAARLEAVTLRTGRAGDGAQGGRGGAGGQGGVGGFAGPGKATGLGHSSGNGGRGGNGQSGGRGGNGAGGSGGSAVGVWCERSTAQRSAVTFKLGAPGLGGAGAGTAGRGEDGAALVTFGCP